MPDQLFAGYPFTHIYLEPSEKSAVVRQLLWGDFLHRTGPTKNGWIPVRYRKHNGFVPTDSVQTNRILEVIMLDIGQGDGCIVITPDDRHLLIDAGAEDNMHRFLRWRYGRFQKPFTFDAFVISHSDLDHYGGFRTVLSEENIRVKTIYHNGIVERATAPTLGPTKKIGKRTYLTDVIADHTSLGNLLKEDNVRGKKIYPNLLHKAMQSGRVKLTQQLAVLDSSSKPVYMPGYGPKSASGLSIQVLGPVCEVQNGQPCLRSLGDTGKTKNGHSVVLKLRYGNLSMLLGGDLNTSSEALLLEHHTGLPMPKKSGQETEDFLAKAREVFQVDIAKACHHGSADFSDLFISAVNPLGTIISSGDDESYAHPRADTLGTLGLHSRGPRPLIFSTELARSASDTIPHPNSFKAGLMEAIATSGSDPSNEKAKERVATIIESIGRSIAVYGAINLRSDGVNTVLAYRLERASSPKQSWDIYQLEPDANNNLRFISKHIEKDEDGS